MIYQITTRRFRGLSLVEVLVASVIIASCIPTVMFLTSGQEREVRAAGHTLDVAALAHQRLGMLEGELQATRFPWEPRARARRTPLRAGDHDITLTEDDRVEPLDRNTGLVRLRVTFTWTEPGAGTRAAANREYAASMLVVDPETALRNPPPVVSRETLWGER